MLLGWCPPGSGAASGAAAAATGLFDARDAEGERGEDGKVDSGGDLL
jgi:hypothetical protein